MFEFSLKVPRYYKIRLFVYLGLTAFFFLSLMYLSGQAEKSDINLIILGLIVIAGFITIIKSIKYDHLLVLSEAYYSFKEREHWIEHNVKTNKVTSIAMQRLYDEYDRWIQDNWVDLNKL